MSTESTDYTWYWYVRRKGRRWYLGIVDQNGDSPDSAYDIDIYYRKLPDEVLTDDDVIPVPLESGMGVLKGVAAEIMGMQKSFDKTLRAEMQKEFNRAIYDATHKAVEESIQPCVQKPFDLRDD